MSNLTESPAALVDLLTKAKLFRGLSDPSRLAILESMRESPRSVSEIVEMTDLTQPNTSNHLSCLLECGLVTRERRGKFVFYALADAVVEDLLSLADHVLADVAGGVCACSRYRDDSSPAGSLPRLSND